MENWYKDWFESVEYLNVYSHREENDAINLFKLIKDSLDLAQNPKILDAACGSGRFSNYLVMKGFDVTSFDLSSQLLKTAQKNTKSMTSAPKYVRADMRFLPFKSTFDLVLNMFTSFGYFNSDKENFSFIISVAKLMAEKGYFIFDFLNKDYVMKNIIPVSRKRVDNKIITEQRKITNNRVEKTITIQSNSKSKVFRESVNLYSKDEIISNFKTFGLKVYKIFGDYHGSEFDKYNSDRLIIIFCK